MITGSTPKREGEIEGVGEREREGREGGRERERVGVKRKKGVERV